MTAQYLIGELSSLLADFEPVPDQAFASALRDLRKKVETCQLSRLPDLTEPAVDLTSRICWASLDGGDLGRFCQEVDAIARLRDFALSARLLAPG